MSEKDPDHFFNLPAQDQVTFSVTQLYQEKQLDCQRSRAQDKNLPTYDEACKPNTTSI